MEPDFEDRDLFWMVFVPSRGKPTKVHQTLASAQEEAARIASKENQKVYILEAIGYTKVKEQPVEWVEV